MWDKKIGITVRNLLCSVAPDESDSIATIEWSEIENNSIEWNRIKIEWN